MSINRDNFDNHDLDIFDDDFEVIYEGDLPDIPMPEDDNFQDVLSNLSDLDRTKNIDYLEENYTTSFDLDEKTKEKYEKASKKKKKKNMPNLFKPLAKTAKAGGKAGAKAIYKTTNLLLRGATLILTGAIIAVLAFHFWQNYKPYGTLAQAIDQHNYVLGAYFAVALFLLLIECITFLTILFGSKTKKDRKGRAADNGRGLFSFLFIYAGSYLSLHLHSLIPASPAPLQGVQGALTIYGNLHSLLLPLCTAGIFICILRRFAVR